MNYYAARQVEVGPNAGRWHYTCRNDDRIWPVGLCQDGCHGHASPEEAQEHYRRYLLGLMKKRGPKEQEWPKEKCCLKECNSEAKYLIDCPGHMGMHFEVCEAHNFVDAIAHLVKVGESMSS